MWNVDNNNVYHLHWLCWFAEKSQITTVDEFSFGGTKPSAVVVVTKNVRKLLFVWAHVTVRKTLFSICMRLIKK